MFASTHQVPQLDFIVAKLTEEMRRTCRGRARQTS